MILIMGGGLSGSLLAYRINQLCPTSELIVIDSQPRLSTESTWSFHDSDLEKDSLEWLKPLISQSWDRQTVHFSSFNRTLETGYHSIRSADFSTQITSQLKNHLLLEESITSITPQGEVLLRSGKRIRPRVIFDARGLQSAQTLPCGYQKFFGLDLEFTHPHSLKHPIIMDTRCAQDEGFKFIYVLPWTKTSALIEATCYANTPQFDEIRYRHEIEQYCHQNQWQIKRTLRSEQAALPIPHQNKPNKSLSDRVIPIGLAGGFFHFTTGYSLPLAVKISEVIAQTIKKNPDWTPESLKRTLIPLVGDTQRQANYFAMLNRMLFLACAPEKRIHIFRRFYSFKKELIERFYRGELTRADQFRILMGKPPVPLLAGLKHAWDSNATDCSWNKGISK